MALDDLLISTGVDQLIRLVRERGRIEVGAAAKELRLPQRTVEDWSHVLEEEGLISIDYKLTKVFLAWRSPSSAYVAQRAEKLEAKATQTKEDVELLLDKVQKGGSELDAIAGELQKVEAAVLMTPEDAEKMKAELAALGKKYTGQAKEASDRLAKLKKKLLSLGFQPEEGEAEKPEKDVGKDLEMLKNFESTIQAQIDDNETFIGTFEDRLEGFRKRIEEGRSDEGLVELRNELGEIKELKSELAGAMEALAEEQQSLHGRVEEVEKKIEDYSEHEDSIAGARKKLSELRKMSEDAKKQKEAVAEQLADALSLVRRHASKLSAMQKKEAERASAHKELKDEYIDIAEEIARANDAIASKQKEVSKKIAAQMAALETMKSGAPERLGSEELEKVSFMLRELKREQELLEEKVRGLGKEADIVRMESEQPPRPKAAAPAAKQAASEEAAPERAPSAAFVEKVKLSQEEETDFERKREELRSLIHRMWEESKGAAPPS